VETREEPVHLKAGTSVTGIQGHIAGRDDVASLGGAEAGQPMTIALHADHQMTNFDGLPPGGEGTVVAASISGDRCEGTLPARADDRVRVHLTRAAHSDLLNNLERTNHAS
jgi:hypothetical protein